MKLIACSVGPINVICVPATLFLTARDPEECGKDQLAEAEARLPIPEPVLKLVQEHTIGVEGRGGGGQQCNQTL